MNMIWQNLNYAPTASFLAALDQVFPEDLDTSAQDLIGYKVNGRYRILRIIGVGGSSTVYEAEDGQLKNTVAIKVLHRHLSRDDERQARFRREAEAVSRLNHRNIARIFEYGILDSGQPYIAMEHFSGRSLRQVVKDEGPLPEGLAVMIFQQICDALQHVHELRLVHADITMSNIFISDRHKANVSVKLIDFGFVKPAPVCGAVKLAQTEDGKAQGTPAYMSPEQCLGLAVDKRSDIFSLGCVMYYTLSGEPPFSGTSLFECLMKRFHIPPRSFAEVCPQLTISPALEAIITKAMEPAIENRFQSAESVKADLGECTVASRRTSSLDLSWLFSALKFRRPTLISDTFI